jgi:hypothetical protein
MFSLPVICGFLVVTCLSFLAAGMTRYLLVALKMAHYVRAETIQISRRID